LYELYDADMDGEYNNLSAETYEVLSSRCTDPDAAANLRGITDLTGFTAWNKLSMKFNPNTLAKMIQAINSVVSPALCKGVQQVEVEMEQWLENVRVLRDKLNLEFPIPALLALLPTMMPSCIKDHLTMNLHKAWSLQDVLDKVRVAASNRTSMTATSSGPTRMDVDLAEEWCNCEEDDCEVEVVGANVVCYNCSGYVHFGPDCPSKVGKAKVKGNCSGGKPSGSKGSAKGAG
jgi:hypothetical protein